MLLNFGVLGVFPTLEGKGPLESDQAPEPTYKFTGHIGYRKT